MTERPDLAAFFMPALLPLLSAAARYLRKLRLFNLK
jgi:hypothetical protein